MKKTLLASTLLLASILGSLVFGLHRVSATGTASLSLSPASGSPNGSGLLTLDIHENSGATAVNAVETDLNFSTGQFNVIGITLASGWTQATFSTCNQGSMQFAAFRTPPGSSSTGDQVVATVTMQAVSTSASAAISFTSSSAIAAADGSGTNVWDGNTTGGTYSITGSSSQRVHVCGSVVKASNNPNVYLIDNGAKRPVTTPSIFVSQGFNWNWISTMTTSDQALATGSPVPYRDGSVIKGSTPSIYVTDNNQKRAITSGAAFNSLGYTAQDIISVPDGQVAALADGTPISSAASHPSGTLITPGSGIYLLSGGTRHYVGSVYILFTHGYNYYQVKPATPADWALPPGNNTSLRTGVLVRDSLLRIFVTDSVAGVTQKDLISSMAVFTGLGYNTGEFINVQPDSVLPPVNGPTL